MNILFISWFFPPGNDVAALRTGAIARHLIGAGLAVHVLTAARAHSDNSLEVPVPEAVVSRAAWFDIDRFRMAEAPGAGAPSASVAAKAKKSAFPALSNFRTNITHI